MTRLAVPLALVLLTAPALADTRRVAIVAGNNAGSGTLPPLRYAESDAGKMARVLVELGEVAPDDLMLLQGRKASEIEQAIADARDRVALWKKNPDTRAVLVFYFSGHSDGESLEVGQERLPYARLKALLTGTGADVRLAVIDACRSGGGLREKGGKPAAPFTIRLTDTLVASGEAFITSSAADEAALESSEVMGSVFTHNFISGLRGAADASGDKLVTLAEAYRYAYDRTVSATSLLPVGVQHPNYDYRMSGQGELVLASLQKPSAVLVMPEGAERSLVTDVVRDQVVVELPGGGIREVVLAPGQYGLRLFKEGRSWGGRVTVGDGARKVVAWSELQPLASSAILARKGAEPGVAAEAPLPSRSDVDSKVLGLSFGLGKLFADPSVPLHGALRVGFEPSRRHHLSLAVVGLHGASPSVAESGLQGRLGFRFAWEFGRLWVGVGAELVAAAYFQQRPNDTLRAAFSGGAAPRAGLRVHLLGPVSLSVDGEVAVLLLSLDGALRAVAEPLGTLGLAFDL